MIPRKEHPNPQWERKTWRNLNGEWEFDFDFGRSARERELFKSGELSKKIIVPFCPESKLSGIGYTDFIPAVCYRKEINLTEEETAGKVFLNFGAVDFHSYIYINGELAGEHIGGYASFKVDITAFVRVGKNEIFVIAEDDTRSGKQPAGKQSQKFHSYGCFYTRTTGIWQTVWLEFVPKSYVKSCKYYPDITNGILTVTGEVSGSGELELNSSYEGKPTGSAKITASGFFSAQIKLSELHLWEVGKGRLYDLEIKFGEDNVKSYFGMREVSLNGLKFMFNHKPLFLRTVLDQGFYPDGIYTAKDEEELKRDIFLSKNAGFDGARLHEKVFEKRFIYHCDKEGYIIWGEHANWGMNYMDMAAQGNFICEWTEIVERDFNSPALIGWCPFNETWGYKEKETDSRLIESVYRITKLYDKTRPCIDVSGNYHIEHKEIHDVHDYEQDTEKFATYYAEIENGIVLDQVKRKEKDVQPYHGEPVFVSEYGGIKWAPNSVNGWGYGNAPKTEKEFIERYCTLTDILISNPNIMGICYTQLYDVEQEQNGLYYYDRTPKFGDETMKKLASVMQKKAAIEE
ncbi:MAG: beta-galactosidase [Ruminococcaceae bacterium]|nr:beta-galactosidase [Oscillospiraceae bacterium]